MRWAQKVRWVWARDQIPAASVQTGICYLGNWGGKICATLFIFVHSFRDAHRRAVHRSGARFFQVDCDHQPLFDTHILYLKPVIFRSVRHLRPHSQTFWRASVMMTANPTPDASAPPSVESTGDSTGTKPSLAKRRANQQDSETFYFTVRSPPLLLVCFTLWPTYVDTSYYSLKLLQ